MTNYRRLVMLWCVMPPKFMVFVAACTDFNIIGQPKEAYMHDRLTRLTVGRAE